MAQFGRPISDVSNSGWTGTPTAGNRWSNIDEITPNDSDYCFGSNNTNGANFEVALTSLTDPVSSSGHIFRFRHAKTAAGTLDGGGGAVTLTVSLYQGATLIASTSVGVTGSWTAGSLTLSGAQADSITNYGDLRLRFSQSGSGGGPNARGAAVSWAELEIPDAIYSDLEIAKVVDVSTPVVGTNVKFTLTAKNNGPSTATNVIVNDLLPSGYAYVSDNPSKGSYNSGTGVWTIGSMADTDVETLEITAEVLGSGSYNNVATISSDSIDTVSGNNTDSASVTPVVIEADISITKVVDVPAPVVGSNVVFTITVRNNGPDTATNVEVADLLPSGLSYVGHSETKGIYDEITGIWDIGSMADTDEEELEITATVLATGDYDNVATVSSDTDDPNAGNNTDNAEVFPLFVDTRLQDKLEAILIARADTVNSISFIQTGDNTSPFVLEIDTNYLTDFFNDGDIRGLVDYLLTAFYELEESIVVSTLEVFDGASSLIELLRFTIYFEHEEILFEEMIAPATPDPESIVIYLDEVDSELKYKDEINNITNI